MKGQCRKLNAHFCSAASEVLDLGMTVDPPPPPRGNFGHYDFLILLYLSNKMRHVSLLRSVALSCNIKITYVTPKMIKYILVSMLKYSLTQLHTYF